MQDLECIKAMNREDNPIQVKILTNNKLPDSLEQFDNMDKELREKIYASLKCKNL
jgi:hypothetical protein